MFARARKEIEVDFTWKRERKKTLDVKLQKYFCDKCTKLLTKRKKCGTMLFGQERIDEKIVKTADKIVTKIKFSYIGGTLLWQT
jgi:hypothetical protein